MLERLQRRRPQDKPLLNLNYAEYVLLFGRAAANLQVDMVPYQGRHSGALVEKTLRKLVSKQKRGRWKSAPSVRRCEKSGRVNQSWSELHQHPAVSFASWSCLPDTTSTASSPVIDLFSSGTDWQRFFLNRGFQCAKLDPFSVENNFLDENSRDFEHVGKWSDPRRSALATSIVAPSCPKSSTSAKCDTTLVSFKNFRLMSGHQRQFVCRRFFCVARACISLKIFSVSDRICGNSVDYKF